MMCTVFTPLAVEYTMYTSLMPCSWMYWEMVQRALRRS